MNLSDIITKCYILALIIRDDGERLLLGDGIYEFKSSLQHFAPNIYQNDVVELQGTDGQLLAGQVRRSATQAFDGYIADGTIGKTDTEQSRRRFLGFFRKKHHYKVVYIMPDGTAVQRDRGYIVDAPAVQELYQRFPEYHIGLNFEDPNYYEYSENDEGEEIYTHIQAIALFRELEAGLVWDAFGAVSDDIAWTEYMTKNSTDGYILIGNGLPVEAPLSLTHLYGNATQETLSGKNLSNIYSIPDKTGAGLNVIVANEKITISNNSNIAGYTNTTIKLSVLCPTLQVGDTVYLFFDTTSSLAQKDNIYIQGTGANIYWAKGTSKTITQAMLDSIVILYGGYNETAVISNFMITKTNEATYEPYCGGVPMPNPQFPSDVKTVSGAQTVKITGKNLLDISNVNTTGSGTNGLTITANSDGSLSWSGTATATWAILTTYTAVNLNAGTYTLSIDKTLEYRLYAEVRFEDGTTTNMIIEAGQTSRTLTFTKNIGQIRLDLSYLGNGQTYDETVKAQFELNSQATDYEPYQAQSCLLDLVLGKNRFSGNFSQFDNRGGNGNTYAYFKLPDDDEYILSLKAKNNVSAQSQQVFIGFSADGGQSGGGVRWVWTNSTTASAGDVKYANNLPSGAGENMHFVSLYAPTEATLQWFVENFYIQLEKGTAPTDYEAYDTIELAKIGTYQDYIWNDNGTWKIHKAIGKVVLDGSESYSYNANYGGFRYRNTDFNVSSANPSNDLICSHFVVATERGTAPTAPIIKTYNNTSDSTYIFLCDGTSDADAFKTWLGTHNTTVYYALATPTDTEITDSELIEQLNHIYELYQGTNNLWLIPSAGAQGEMTVRFGVAYDDDGSGYHWSEELGSPDNIISNDGIDSVRPIWTINGPATNPTLTNITTAQTITWNGTVPADSTLIIDMERQTATLNGANVYAQIEGDWLELAVGPNKLQYTASGGATADSTLEWNGVAG